MRYPTKHELSHKWKLTHKLHEFHPLLKQKKKVLSLVHSEQLPHLSSHLGQLRTLLIKEKRIWRSIKLQEHMLHGSTDQRELTAEERQFVVENISQVKHLAPTLCAKLIDYAVSEANYYKEANHHFEQFTHACDAATCLDMIQDKIERQLFLSTKIQSKASIDATTLFRDVDELHMCVADQHALISRLPYFTMQDIL